MKNQPQTHAEVRAEPKGQRLLLPFKDECLSTVRKLRTTGETLG
ncbi:MAG: hypothetical protein ABSH34_15960 [Verrucomicrobiota bacterium]|jgi:hypothetical protein